MGMRPPALGSEVKVRRRARIQGSWTFESLNSRLESDDEEEAVWRLQVGTWGLEFGV